MSVARCDVNEFDCLWFLEMSESCWKVHVAWCHILSVFVAGGELRTMTKTFWENLKNFLSSSNFRDALENRSSCFQSLHMKMSSEKFFFLIRTEILKNLYDFSPRHVAWVVWREIHSFVSRKKTFNICWSYLRQRRRRTGEHSKLIIFGVKWIRKYLQMQHKFSIILSFHSFVCVMESSETCSLCFFPCLGITWVYAFPYQS